MKKIFVLFLMFLLSPVFAYYSGDYTTDIPNACGDFADLHADWTPIEYTCASGDFLPANTLGCRACPDDATCAGGTFAFNEKYIQGISFSNPTTQNQSNLCHAGHNIVYAVFTIKQYNCDAGYYLPAGADWLSDNDGCTLCPADSYCPGGTYTFNETLTQGIVSCDTGLYAPMGMWESAQCGRILHIGDEVVYLRATKKTSPALHIDIDNDGVADFFGNMTTVDVSMHRETERKLKLQYNGITYSVYDDTIVLPIN